MRTVGKVALGPFWTGTTVSVVEPDQGHGYALVIDGTPHRVEIWNASGDQLAHLALLLAGLSEVRNVFASMEQMLGIVKALDAPQGSELSYNVPKGG